jgi:hypothetical protein
VIRRVARASAIVVALLTIVPARAAAPADLPGSEGATRPVVAVDPNREAYVAATSAAGDPLVWTVDDAVSLHATGGLFAALPAGPPAGIAIDAAGYPHLAERTTVGVTVRRSIDGAQTWDRGSAAAPPADRVSLAAGRFNSVVEGATLVLASESSGAVTVARSNDGGLTFTQRSVASADPSRACTLGELVSDETADRVWIALRCADRVMVLRSTDGGQTFAPATDIPATGSREVVFARDRDGTLLVAWTDDDGIRVARSTDDGDSWRTVASIAGADNVTVAAGSNGEALIAWTSGGNVEAARSTDGGETFGAPVRIDEGRDALALAANPSGGFVLCYQSGNGLRAVRL